MKRDAFHIGLLVPTDSYTVTDGLVTFLVLLKICTDVKKKII